MPLIRAIGLIYYPCYNYLLKICKQSQKSNNLYLFLLNCKEIIYNEQRI